MAAGAERALEADPGDPLPGAVRGEGAVSASGPKNASWDEATTSALP